MNGIIGLNQRMEDAFRAAFPGDERRLVFGEGPVNAPILLIGEAPGEQEALQGRPFVGKAGKNLDGFLAVIGLNREDIRISNVVKVRPTKTSPKGRLSNRPPNRAELSFFNPFLTEEISLVRPRIVVTLGNTALQALLGKEAVIGDVHGQLIRAGEYALFPLYHPASIIYNRALQAVYDADLQTLKKALLPGELSSQ